MTAGRWLLLGAFLAGLAAWVTWPQVISPLSVSDFGDPLLNSWALAWVAHAVHAQPLHLFDANMFFPESNTLAYSEPMLLPALVLAPLSWAGADPILVHNVLLLVGLVLSGLTMFALARYLVGSNLPAVVAAVVFTVYPYRTEAFAKVQLELVFWIPLVLLSLHRLVREQRLWFGVRAGLFMGLQAFTCLYYAIFGAFFCFVAGVVLLVRAPRPRHAAAGFALAGLVGLCVSAPLAGTYLRASRAVGERTAEDVIRGSADFHDYRTAYPDNWLYGSSDHPGVAEKRLFPGYTNIAFALAGAVANPAAAGVYAIGAVTSLDLSLGVNGAGYRWLYGHLWPFRAVRVPARFGMLVGLAMAVLAAFATDWLLRNRRQSSRLLLASGLVFATMLESQNRRLDLSRLPEQNPAVYQWLAAQPDGVVCEYPLGDLSGRIGPQDPTYEYYSTKHWKPLVNGYSGFAPPSYFELKARLTTFPSDESIEYLRQGHVRYLVVHQGFYLRGDYEADIARLRQNPRARWMGAFRWRDGSQSTVFVLEPA